MKIGILSMQKVVNYGSFLQAYGLREIIKDVTGEKEIVFIDIKKGYRLKSNKGFNLYIKRIRGVIKAIFKGLLFEKIKDTKYLNTLSEQFDKHFFPILGIDKPCFGDDIFDCVVIGSDEVFHCCQNAEWGFTTQLLGNIENTKDVVSYAASFGTTTYNQINKNGIKNAVVESLSKLKYISVRDFNSFNNIELLLNKKPSINLDPVLLFDFSKEIERSSDFFSDDDFLIVYSYTGRITDKKEIDSIKKIARDKKLKIYTIFCRYKWADKVIFPESPFQMLKIFRMAKYVISDTFHGSIFSIITHSKFCTLIRKTNQEKMESMLSMLGLSDRAIYNSSDIENVLEHDIDFKKVDLIREKEYQKSFEYLSRCFE